MPHHKTIIELMKVKECTHCKLKSKKVFSSLFIGFHFKPVSSAQDSYKWDDSPRSRTTTLGTTSPGATSP